MRRVGSAALRLLRPAVRWNYRSRNDGGKLSRTDVVVREQRMQRQPETEGRFLADRLLGRSRGQRILAGSDQSFDLTRIFPRSKPRSNSVVAIFSASYLPRTGAITLRASPQHHNVDPTTLRSYKICRSVVEAVLVVVLVVIVVVDRYTLSRCLGL